ncbi:MAG TPA: carboxymuconolactone decarboxylase family protein [Gemmatimonadaceae bacterium]|nr:carboxymuconolactone decarboxylase family protein [Gemmatimonadaceae bacterium]
MTNATSTGRRIDYRRVAPDGTGAVRALEQYVRGCGLEKPLLELVKLCASYMNGCAYCVDMHTKDARAEGETEQRLYAVPVWRETPFYTPRERAALAWTEAVTALGRDGVPEQLFDETREHFSERELADLTYAVIVINCWNRLSIALGSDVGSYQPPSSRA